MCITPNHHMRYAAAGLAMVVTAAFVAAGVHHTAQAAFAQTIQNDQQYIGDDGSLHVVGEIVNDSDVPISGASVEITIHDRDGQPILARETGSLMNTIMPGMRGPFDLILADGQTSRQILQEGGGRYTLNLDYNFAPPKSQVIEIAESEMARDMHNNLVIKGMVKNKGMMTANTVSVVATIYDDAGDVAAVARTHPEPDYLRAGESVFFVISVPDKEHTVGASRYDLMAESEEYAAVPEFPAGIVMVLLAGTMVAYVAVTRFSRISMTNQTFAAKAG